MDACCSFFSVSDILPCKVHFEEAMIEKFIV